MSRVPLSLHSDDLLPSSRRGVSPKALGALTSAPALSMRCTGSCMKRWGHLESSCLAFRSKEHSHRTLDMLFSCLDPNRSTSGHTNASACFRKWHAQVRHGRTCCGSARVLWALLSRQSPQPQPTSDEGQYCLVFDANGCEARKWLHLKLRV